MPTHGVLIRLESMEVPRGGGKSRTMADASDASEATITATEMDKMSPQERADAVDAATTRSWDDVPEPFRSEVLETARVLGQHRRQRA